MAKFIYTMKDLSRITDRTPSRIYNYFNEDVEFYKSDSHRKKDSKKGYIYDEEILKRLKNRVSVEDGEGVGENKKGLEENPISSAPAMMEELEDLKVKFAALQGDFESAKAQIEQLQSENALKSNEINQLLLIIQQEKAEKQKIMLMLPPPRKSIGARIMDLFRKNKTE